MIPLAEKRLQHLITRVNENNELMSQYISELGRILERWDTQVKHTFPHNITFKSPSADCSRPNHPTISPRHSWLRLLRTREAQVGLVSLLKQLLQLQHPNK
jgi:hypothetical protein